MSFANIMNAVEDVVSQFQGGWISWNRWVGPLFSDESSNMEYSSATKLSISASSPTFENDFYSTGTSTVFIQEFIVFTKDLNEDEEIDVVL